MEDPTVIKQLIDTYWRARLETPLTDQQSQQQLNLHLTSQRQHRQNEEVDARQTKLAL